jgi:quinol monooxygenase YgiN
VRGNFQSGRNELAERAITSMHAERGEEMDKFALLALLEAKPGKEKEVEEFLKSAQPMAAQEAGTTTWYAVKLGPAKFGIFDTFKDEESREAHLSGEIAKALMANAGELLAKAPQIQKLDILALKAPGA